MSTASTDTLPAAIDSIDFAAIRRRLVISAGFEDWRADRAIRMYRTFLAMCAEFPEREIAPPRDADIAWHYHILDTRTYPADCRRIFGRLLHHDPDVHGSPRFWEAWDFARSHYAARLGIDLPWRDDVPMEDGLQPETCAAATGDTGLGPQTCTVLATDDGLAPQTCTAIARDDGLAPQTCTVLAKDDGLAPQTCTAIAAGA